MGNLFENIVKFFMRNMGLRKKVNNYLVIVYYSCVFVWRLPVEFSQYMHARLKELGKNPKQLNAEIDIRFVVKQNK